MADFSHLDDKGRPRMVDVGDKEISRREAVAKGNVLMQAETLARIRDGSGPKGDVLSVAKLAGIMAAKRTDELIPLCHSLPLDVVEVDLVALDGPPRVEITARAKITGRTGVEMEALTAVTVAALTVYDMCKAVDRAMRLSDIRLIEKTGGRSGRFTAL